jgi:hypothetical protein
VSASRLPKNLPVTEQPLQFVLLCLGCAALGASVGLFGTGSWVGGVVLLLLAVGFFAALLQPVPQKGTRWSEQSATAAAVWRTRVATSLNNRRTRSRLHGIESERAPALQALGVAVREGDRRAAQEASMRLDELDERQRGLEAELERQVALAKERVRLTRLPVQETVMVAPTAGNVGGKADGARLEGPGEPYPPPGEANPPTPAIVPEPSPPPDEGTPPTPPEPREPDES